MFVAILMSALLLEETPEFLLSKGREAEAAEVIKKISKLNSRVLPSNFKLQPDSRKFGQTPENLYINDEKQQSYCYLLFSVMKNRKIMKSFVTIIFIGAAAKLISDGLNYILTDLVFLQGQSGDYCHGSDLKTYYVTKSDYVKLLVAQIAGVITLFVSFPILKLKISLKYQSLFCFSLSVILVSFLYFCPDIYIVFALMTVMRVAMQIINISSTLALIQLNVPTRVRGLIVGSGQVLRNSLLPINIFFTQALSKKSQHYVTSLTLFALLLGLAAAVFVPQNINEDNQEKDNCILETSLKKDDLIDVKLDKLDES